jgi:hypothetical protein
MQELTGQRVALGALVVGLESTYSSITFSSHQALTPLIVLQAVVMSRVLDWVCLISISLLSPLVILLFTTHFNRPAERVGHH